MSTHPIQTLFLRDTAHGGSTGQLAEVATHLAAFISAATSSVDVAIYDFRLTDPTVVTTVVGALIDAADRGVTVRVGYDAGKPAGMTALDFAAVGGDPAPVDTPSWVEAHLGGTKVQIEAISAGVQLMHHKYVVRDGAAVWTGSTNFTDDAWTRQENNVVTITSTPLAIAFQKDFDAMWAASKTAGSGAGDAGSAPLGRGTLGWDFCPGDGTAVDAALAARITAAGARLLVASMVITSHDVLAALAAAVARKVPLSGVYDATQMGPIAAQWKGSAFDAQVLADWTTVKAHLVGKNSTPYSPTGLHDFMHLKVMVADDAVVTGSYNFSANAEKNAENQVHLTDPATVAAYVAFIETVTKAYS